MKLRNRSAFMVLALSVLGVSTPVHAGGGCVPGKVTGSRGSYQSYRTGYYPDSSEMEGGFTDRNGHPLRTLQAYLRGEASYVSVAMDHTDRRFPYGTKLRIPAVEKHFGRCIEFRVVDSGGRFTGRGASKIDICNDNNAHAEAGYSNGSATIYVVGSVGGGGGDDEDQDQEPRPRKRWGNGGNDDNPDGEDASDGDDSGDGGDEDR